MKTKMNFINCAHQHTERVSHTNIPSTSLFMSVQAQQPVVEPNAHNRRKKGLIAKIRDKLLQPFRRHDGDRPNNNRPSVSEAQLQRDEEYARELQRQEMLMRNNQGDQRVSAHSSQSALNTQDRRELYRLLRRLLNEIDTYERVMNRYWFFRLMPPLSFHVTVVQNVNGQRRERDVIMTLPELRNHVLQTLQNLERTEGVTGGGVHGYVSDVGLGLQEMAQFRHRGVRNVERFPVHVHDGGPLPEDKNTCSVCLSNYTEGQEIRTIPCLHFYHKECIDEWLRVSRLCPICKTEIQE
jgi:hypothetical protein